MSGDPNPVDFLIQQATKTTSVEHLHDLVTSIDNLLVRQTIFELVTKRLDQKAGVLRGDHADFHNLATEGFRTNASEFSLRRLDEGLKQNRDHPVLVGDKIQALKNLGRPYDAIEMGLKYWRRTQPRKFSFDWRVAVFFKDTVQQIDPSFDDEIPSRYRKLLPPRMVLDQKAVKWGDVVEELLTTVGTHNATHIKIWHELAEVHSARGNHAQTIEVLKNGLATNPFSQQLRFALGQVYLARFAEHAIGSSPGDAIDEAITYLEQALTCDFQDQFQPDVSPLAVMLRLAQAYEARAILKDDEEALRKAQSIYEQLKEESGHFGSYSSNRLRHIRTYVQLSARLED